jgi:hypothetical protein
MTRRRLVSVFVGVGVGVAGIVAAVILLVLDRDLSSRPALPPGPPVVARASFAPALHLFGDVVLARIEVETDVGRVDPGSIRLRARTEPYVHAGSVRLRRSALGRIERLEYVIPLVCLRAECTLSTPSSPRTNPPTQKTFTLPSALVSYRQKGARQDSSLTVPWPGLTVATRISSARADDFAFTTDLAVPKPAYALDADALVALLIVIGLALVVTPLALALRGVPRRLLRGAGGPRLSGLEQALLLLDWASRRDAADRRRALERVALELGREGRAGLAEQPRVVAWSRADPDPDVAATIGEEVRRTTSTMDGNHR